MTDLPDTQQAVLLTGPSTLERVTDKPVTAPGPHQILVKIEAVGLCFSDLKLLKQFSEHPRKGRVVSGVEPGVLTSLPSYVPDDKPTVPGHEVVGDVVAIGEGVQYHSVGERVLVQADWRFLKTEGSNGAFGYNFEGGLQEYVLFDERIVMEPGSGQRYLIPVSKDLSASAAALVEPWACVENSYATAERQTIKADGKLLVVFEEGHDATGLEEAFSPDASPAEVRTQPADVTEIAQLPDEHYDDIVYFGAVADTINALNDKLAAGGILAVVTAGKKIGQPVSVGVGRVHYGGTRWIGTTGGSAREAYATIPADGELRDGDSVVVVGAGGPMGQMHTIRAASAPAANLTLIATDLDDARLDALARKVQPLAESNGISATFQNTKTTPLAEEYTYFALMAPLGVLVEQAIAQAAPGALINIFAGIPAPTRHDLDLDRYIERGLFMFGTSGSRIEDMQAVLDKVTDGQLDTNRSVDAVCGMDGAVDGIAAVENRTLAGKIIVYPCLHDLPLVSLHDLGEHHAAAAEKLDEGVWTADAEQALTGGTR